VGTVHNFLLDVTGASSTLSNIRMAGNLLNAAEAAYYGDPSAALMMAGQAVFQRMGSVKTCGLGAWAQLGQRSMMLAGAGYSAYQGVNQVMAGNYVQGLVNIGYAGLGAYRWWQSCFVAGTPLLTPEGSKPIETFRKGDMLLSRSEHDPDGPVAAKVVEDVFVRLGKVLLLKVQGREIKTTAEHPFWVWGRGWVEAGKLVVGDWLSSDYGRWVAVEAVEDTGGFEVVYNLRVADYHTYFVGAPEWGFSIWAHNDNCTIIRHEGDPVHFSVQVQSGPNSLQTHQVVTGRGGTSTAIVTAGQVDPGAVVRSATVSLPNAGQAMAAQ
jgi:hypothetical protein